MTELNGNQPEQSPAPSGPDFNQEVRNAQMSGDYDFVLDTAKKSHAMLVDFRDTVKRATFLGKDAACIAQGLNFLENMVAQSASQIDGLKRAEKQTREQIKAALRNQGKSKMAVVGPETPPETPADLPSAPSQEPSGDAPTVPPAGEATGA